MKEFGLYAKLPIFKKRVEIAKSWIDKALDIDGKWSISFSGGKDSTVLLDLVPTHIDIVWFDDGWDYPETIEFIKQTEERLNRKIYRVSWPLSAEFWKKEAAYPGDDPSYSHDCDMSRDEWKKIYNACFIGLRKEESKWRNLTLKWKGPLYFNKEYNHCHCCPLASWTFQDVWAYIISRGLSYNPVYDKLKTLGVEPKYSRVGPLTAHMVYQYGALATLKAGWPELFNRFAAAMPEARLYV